MSATGRNLEGSERHAHDFYETPGWATRAILPHLGSPETILDCGTGTGAIAREASAFFKRASVYGIEKEEYLYKNAVLLKRPGLEFIHGDFFEQAPLLAGHFFAGTFRGFDLVIGNPPYNQAEAFAETAIACGKTVALLLRINWLASKKRAPFHRAHPSDLYVLPRRPSFTNGGTDATEYAWFVWGEGTIKESSVLSPFGESVRLERFQRGNRWFLLDVEDR
jgi:hypothetical protein